MSACKSPRIILIPSGSTLINPLKFRRSQDFYIVSLIELNCNDSTSIESQWIVKNNSNVISFDSQIETTSSELFIPSRKLPLMLFRSILKLKQHRVNYLFHRENFLLESLNLN